MPISEYRELLRDRLDVEGHTYSLIHALGRGTMYNYRNWSPVIRQRLIDERNERAFQRTERKSPCS